MQKKVKFEDMVRIKRDNTMHNPPVPARIDEHEKNVPVIKVSETPEREHFTKEPELKTQKHKENLPYREIVYKDQKNSSSKFALPFIALFAMLGLFFAFSSYYAIATVTISPKIEDLTLNQTFSASKDSTISNLPFEVVIISGEQSLEVVTSEEKDYEERASGIALLYNAHSFSPQNLAIDTRLEASNGKIYKTKIATTIPGIRKEDGLPGVIEVPIYASEPGADYNSEPLDFKIFGFKGTPKYDDFYGRSKGSISGGISGKMRSLSTIDRSIASTQLKNTLEENLLKQATTQIPAGYLLYPSAVSFSVDEEDIPIASPSETAKATMKGTLAGMLIKESDLVNKIAEVAIRDYDGTPITINGIKDLSFSFAVRETLFWDSESVDFKLVGPIQIVYKVDEDNIKNSLLARKKNDFEGILNAQKNINSAELSMRPFWQKTFPKNIEKIKLIVNYP